MVQTPVQGEGIGVASIVVGIGGWTFAPWRNSFYPAGLPHAQELSHASRQITSIEINGTFYRTQDPASFAHWRDSAPDGFIFAVKAARGTTHLKDITEAGAAIERFLGSGVTELGPKLGPILWQFPHTKKFDGVGFEAWLQLLPTERDGLPLRHVVEARHPTFADPAFLAKIACGWNLGTRLRVRRLLSPTELRRPSHSYSCADAAILVSEARIVKSLVLGSREPNRVARQIVLQSADHAVDAHRASRQVSTTCLDW